MPDRRQTNDVPERIERLSRGIDRVVAGQPTPVMDDPELQELLQLAARLRQELPEDLPDPGFRSDLKGRLTTGRPALVPVATGKSRSKVAFPYGIAAGAIAAVLVAAVAVGTLAVRMNADDDNGIAGSNGDATAGVATTPAVAFSTTTPNTSLFVASPTPPTRSQSPESTVVPNISPTAPSAEFTPTVSLAIATEPANATATRAPTVASTRAPQSSPTSQTPATANATDEPQLADVPPIDTDHVVSGPVPTTENGGETPNPAVAVELDTTLPDLGESAPLYTLAPPDVEPAELVEGVAESLDIDGTVVEATNAFGDDEYSVDGSDGSAFTWIPESGGFTFTLPDSEASPPVDAELTPEQAVDNTLAWLDSIGYPSDSLTAPPVAEKGPGGAYWYVQLWTDNVPFNSFGHPLGVIIYLNSAGVVTSGTGFWLTVDGEEQTPIVSSADAWAAIQAHKGYWTGGVTETGGTLTIDTIFLGYALTHDGANNSELVFQPTIIAQGNFVAADGGKTRVTVYVQATR